MDIAASYLVPGDAIRILPDGGVMPCDAVLFTGKFIVHVCFVWICDSLYVLTLISECFTNSILDLI